MKGLRLFQSTTQEPLQKFYIPHLAEPIDWIELKIFWREREPFLAKYASIDNWKNMLCTGTKSFIFRVLVLVHTLISPVFLSSSYLTLLPFVISTTCTIPISNSTNRYFQKFSRRNRIPLGSWKLLQEKRKLLEIWERLKKVGSWHMESN